MTVARPARRRAWPHRAPFRRRPDPSTPPPRSAAPGRRTPPRRPPPCRGRIAPTTPGHRPGHRAGTRTGSGPSRSFVPSASRRPGGPTRPRRSTGRRPAIRRRGNSRLQTIARRVGNAAWVRLPEILRREESLPGRRVAPTIGQPGGQPGPSARRHDDRHLSVAQPAGQREGGRADQARNRYPTPRTVSMYDACSPSFFRSPATWTSTDRSVTG